MAAVQAACDLHAMRFLAFGFTALLLAGLAGLSVAPVLGQSAAPALTIPVTFPPGSALTTLNGQLALGSSDLYLVTAKSGQTLLVSVATPDGDVSFEVYAPGASATKSADGKTGVRGKTLPDAGSDDHAKAWVGAISRSGNYLIAVTLGETGPVLTDYSLTISLQ
jgi:hypothetical protein